MWRGRGGEEYKIIQDKQLILYIEASKYLYLEVFILCKKWVSFEYIKN